MEEPQGGSRGEKTTEGRFSAATVDSGYVNKFEADSCKKQ